VAKSAAPVSIKPNLGRDDVKSIGLAFWTGQTTPQKMEVSKTAKTSNEKYVENPMYLKRVYRFNNNCALPALKYRNLIPSDISSLSSYEKTFSFPETDPGVSNITSSPRRKGGQSDVRDFQSCDLEKPGATARVCGPLMASGRSRVQQIPRSKPSPTTAPNSIVYLDLVRL
jgi:hypothetical protein